MQNVKETEMKVLSDGGGTWLVSDDDEVFNQYKENGWEFENDGTSCQKCGEAELFDDVEIDGNADGDCEVRISYLVHRGGARYERVEYRGNFSGRELIGKWEEIYR